MHSSGRLHELHGLMTDHVVDGIGFYSVFVCKGFVRVGDGYLMRNHDRLDVSQDGSQVGQPHEATSAAG